MAWTCLLVLDRGKDQARGKILRHEQANRTTCWTLNRVFCCVLRVIGVLQMFQRDSIECVFYSLWTPLQNLQRSAMHSTRN